MSKSIFGRTDVEDTVQQIMWHLLSEIPREKLSLGRGTRNEPASLEQPLFFSYNEHQPLLSTGY